ncbi:MAG: flagellar hook-basal body complex protein FliE [Deltaproteobacteria bacterium RIFOXYD12_FULL_50_9]|nr:MAG: flagellar hook-basal body complex protein FliE [Deltaproteobacteria bacterium RIFOXYD12_FULL_50_9]
MNAISNVSSVLGSAGQAAGVKSSGEDDGTGFGKVLKSSIDAVNNRIAEADELSNGLVSGQHSNIHETMIAMEEASISFKLLAKFHTKAIAAYQEIMRMQV